MKLLFIFLPLFVFSKNICDLPKSIESIVTEVKISSVSDLKRNNLEGLCISQIEFNDKDVLWNFLLLWNPSQPKGPAIFIPHDNENTAFDTGIYTIQTYGGAILSVTGYGKRFYKGIDPNRNFKDNIYSKNIFKILDSFRSGDFGYIALHNNNKGYIGNGGTGTVSIKYNRKGIKNFPVSKEDNIGISNEDSLVYFIGSKVNIDKVKLVNSFGINVSYELIKGKQNDFSMSNYIYHNLKDKRYINIETLFGDFKIQKKILDQLFLII